MPRFLIACLLALPLAPAVGQERPSTLSRGFTAAAPSVATAEELAQGDLWVMQVEFKPLRLIQVDVPDPRTGETRKETVWYLVYRAENKPLQSPQQEEGRIPVNNYDPPPGPSLLIPEFQLITNDNNVQQVYPDVVIPAAQAAIAEREMRGIDQSQTLKNSVEIVQPIPASDDPKAKPIYGVAMWRGIDPGTDNFKVFASGFSNGYREVTGPDGKPLILRREIVLDFWRPGDEFDLSEREFRLRKAPSWVYRADEAKPTDPGQDALISIPAASES